MQNFCITEEPMPRKKREYSSIYPYHLSARCINRSWFRIPIDDVWDIFCDYLYFIKFAYKIDIHSFVLMNNHFHMLATFPDGNISECMNYFMREVSKEITRKSGRINQTFGGPFHSSLIKSHHYYLHAYKYVYRNPVEAGLCENADLYKYSTLSGLIGNSSLVIPVINDETLFSDFEGTLNWINKGYLNDHKEKIQAALKRTEFGFSKVGSNRILDELETSIS